MTRKKSSVSNGIWKLFVLVKLDDVKTTEKNKKILSRVWSLQTFEALNADTEKNNMVRHHLIISHLGSHSLMSYY